jgi:transposase
MTPSDDSEPDEIESLKRLLVTERAARFVAEQNAMRAEAEAAFAAARVSGAEAMIAHLKLAIEKMRRELFGSRSERGHKLLDQMEFELEDLEATAAQDEAAAEMAAMQAGLPALIPAHQRRRSGRRPFPDHLPRERVVIPGPSSCVCCGSFRLAKLGEDITETLEVVPRQWKVIQHVREKFTCRACETISQAPAPFHVIARGHAGPSLLAMILHAKFALHQPLNRQSETYAREGVDLRLSTLADHVGACAAALAPLAELIRAHVLAAVRVHGDDTPVPLLAKGRTVQARLWTYVRDDRPFGGVDPPAAFYVFSRDRKGEHPERHLESYAGILQADAYAGFNALYKAERQPGPITEAACWSHARRKFFVLADVASKARSRKPMIVAPLALEAVRRFDAIFEAERSLNGLSPDLRLEGRRRSVAPFVEDLERWMRAERGKMSRHSDVAKAMDYMLTRWPAFVRFLEDGRICLSNNAAERALRGIALGRKAWLFAGSERGGERAAIIYTLIQTAKLNDVDPHAWLADVLARIADQPARRLDELLPWNWRRLPQTLVAAAA